MSEELDLLKAVTKRLAETDIPYMITGSMAANYYAVPRMTRDIDMVIELSAGDVERVVRLFEGEFYVDRDIVEEAVQHQGIFNMIHRATVIKIDFVVRKDLAYRREEFSRRKRVSVEGQEMFFVTPEDLILSKLEWAKSSRSEMQLNDVKNLLAYVENLDRAYLARWAAVLDVEDLYREVTA